MPSNHSGAWTGKRRCGGRAAATPIARSTLVCTVCGASEDIELDVLGLLGRSTVRALGAEIVSHTIELRGRCGACRALARPRIGRGDA